MSSSSSLKIGAVRKQPNAQSKMRPGKLTGKQKAKVQKRAPRARARVGSGENVAPIYAMDDPRSVNNAKPKTEWEKFLGGLEQGLGIGGQILDIASMFLATPKSGSIHAIKFSKNKSTRSVRTAVPLATGFNIPASKPPKLVSRGDRMTICHSGLLGEVTIPAGTKTGEVICEFNIDPLIEEWLAHVSLFEKYAFKEIAFIYKPFVGADTEGGIVAYPEWDVDEPDIANQGEESLRLALAHAGGISTNVWQDCVWSLNDREEPSELWYVDKFGREPRLTTQGRFVVMAGSDYADEIKAGLIEVCYEIQLAIPEMGSKYQGCSSRGYVWIRNGSNTIDASSKFTLDPAWYYGGHGLYQPIPNNVPVHVALNKYIMLPPGFWRVDAYGPATTTASATNHYTYALHGSYSHIYGDNAGVYPETSNASEVTGTTSVHNMMTFSIVSTGVSFEDAPDSGFTLGITNNVTADSQIFVRISALDISPTYQSMATYTTKVSEEKYLREIIDRQMGVVPKTPSAVDRRRRRAINGLHLRKDSLPLKHEEDASIKKVTVFPPVPQPVPTPAPSQPMQLLGRTR